MLELALENAEEVCQAETSSIWELDEVRRELFFRIVRGRAAGAIRGIRVPVGEGIVGSVAQSGEAEMVNDVAADPRWHGDPASSFQTRAILTVPLRGAGERSSASSSCSTRWGATASRRTTCGRCASSRPSSLRRCRTPACGRRSGGSSSTW